jgi:hypothetical protein
MRNLSISLLLFFALGACKAQDKKQAHRPTKDPVVYRGVIDKKCAVEMQFGSYSAGIDDKAYRQTMDMIGRWEVSYTKTTIGREGEKRLCLPLTELSKSRKRVFIDSLKKIARGGQLVSVSIR